VTGETLQIWVDPVIFETIQAEWEAPPWGVRPGAFGVGTANEGQLVNAVELPESDLYVRKAPRSAYGTTTTVRSLVAALTEFRSTSPYGGVVYISAISRPRGGTLGQHKSHQTGRDVDIRLPLREEIPQKLSPIPSRRVDWLATYQLIRAIVNTQQVVYVFLDYKLQRKMHRAAEAAGVETEELAWMMQWPRGRKASRGVVRDSPGHDDHFHVRFRCGIAEPECVAMVPEERPLGLYPEPEALASR
jgi:murein endopeptidase